MNAAQRRAYAADMARVRDFHDDDVYDFRTGYQRRTDGEDRMLRSVRTAKAADLAEARNVAGAVEAFENEGGRPC